MFRRNHGKVSGLAPATYILPSALMFRIWYSAVFGFVKKNSHHRPNGLVPKVMKSQAWRDSLSLVKFPEYVLKKYDSDSSQFLNS